jgi:exodeoxyribonuclease VII large subunit
VVIFPTDVQGDRAAAGIAEGIRYLGQCDVDLVVLTRGGGPIEDLWPFNEEVVARAIAGSPKPVVSAVGHETDFTISDFVADLRAPTPSAAAEMIVRSKIELAERLDAAERRMTGAVRYRLSQLRRFLAERVGGGGFAVAGQQLRTLSQRVDDCAFRLERVARTGGLTADRRQKLDTLSTRAAHLLERIAVQARRRLAGREAGSHREMIRAMSDRRQRFIAAAETLDALSPLAVLDRGYAVCRTRDGQVVRSVGQVAPDSEVAILLHEGELEARVTAVMPGRERGGSAEGPGGTPRGRPGGEGEQG